MKKLTLISAATCLVACFSFSANSQSLAFRKGSFQINVTEGSTFTNYSTTNLETSVGEGGHTIGCRDPLQLEYGLTNRWGIGISMGTDLYTLNGYEFTQVHGTTTEFTLDASYHFFVTPKVDLAGVASWGSSTLNFKGGTGDNSFSYATKGDIGRIGIHGRFFILGHFGITAMVTAFSETGVQQATGNAYSVSMWGLAKELGFCYRINK